MDTVYTSSVKCPTTIMQQQPCQSISMALWILSHMFKLEWALPSASPAANSTTLIISLFGRINCFSSRTMYMRNTHSHSRCIKCLATFKSSQNKFFRTGSTSFNLNISEAPIATTMMLDKVSSKESAPNPVLFSPHHPHHPHYSGVL